MQRTSMPGENRTVALDRIVSVLLHDVETLTRRALRFWELCI